jgi:hypothetical protein
MRAQLRVLMSIVWASAACVHAATLSAPGQISSPGNSVLVSLSFSSGGQSISAIQFDLTGNPALDIRVAPGAQVGLAAKTLYSAVVHPGIVRYVIVGMDAGTLSDGQVIQLFITVNYGAATGLVQLGLTNLYATDPDGNSVPLLADPISIQILGGNPLQPTNRIGVPKTPTRRGGGDGRASAGFDGWLAVGLLSRLAP